MSGTITRGKLMNAYTDVYVTFSSGANIQVVSGFANVTNNFSYVVPTLAGATATHLRARGRALRFALHHRAQDRAHPEPSQCAVVLPDPATLMGPLGAPR